MVKNVLFYRKIPLKSFLILLAFIPIHNQAQSVSRQCISSYGAIFSADGFSVMQTIGQPFGTLPTDQIKSAFSPGFQQSVVFKSGQILVGELKSFDMNVYPNPATNSVIIQVFDPAENYILRITDLFGKLIMSDNNAHLQAYTLNCSGWPDGIYFITVTDSDHRRSSVKLIIKK